MSWKATTIGSLGRVLTGKTPLRSRPDYFDSAHPFVTPSDIGFTHYYCTSVAEGVSELGFERHSSLVIPKDAVMCVCIGSTIGKCALASEPSITNQQINSIIANECHDAKFIYYLLCHVRERIRAVGLGGGAAQPIINKTKFSALDVSVPELKVQQAISEILSAYDDEIANNRRRIRLLEEAARLLYREWFVYFRFPGHEHVKVTNGLPEGWKPRTLSDVVEVVSETVKPSAFAEDDVHIGLEHIPRRSFTLSEWEPAKDLASGKTRFKQGYILFGKIRPYFHKVGFTLCNGLASSDAIVMRVREEGDWPLAVCATASDRFIAVASKTVREGSKMPRADWDVLKKYPMPRPSSTVLQLFSDSVLPITEQCRNLALQNRALEAARDLLLPRLMSGEIAV